jgi:hypothetical protein
MDFEVDVVIIVGAEGMKTKTRFLFGMGFPESYQSVEIVILG